MIDLSGIWKIRLDWKEEGIASGWFKESFGADTIELPGILQAQGYGADITEETPWVSGLHDPFWYKRAEYSYDQENGCQVPFLSQPPKHFVGKAWYQRDIEVGAEAAGEMSLFVEQTRWKSRVWLDGQFCGEDLTLCTAHEISLGAVAPGTHTITVCIDNSMIYPYRPDGHGVSDALGATWNGMTGEISLLSAEEKYEREQAKVQYAGKHPRKVEVREGLFYVDGVPEYFRGTHFGGDYPLTGYPVTERAWWDRVMATVKEWGLNFIRCHSCCLPEAAFAAADEAGVYIQVECGMWNNFEDGIPMLDILREETRRILEQFGHHPSFVLFSPTNEPGGAWYQPLRRWVTETRAYDEQLDYAGRRVYTAQSGWFYEVAPKDIEGTDYIYFHRSAYGPFLGGNIRNHEGWKGKDYRSSLEGAKLPVISHEMGQWCSYPDFSVADKFTGYLQPGNYRIFRENARAHGLLDINRELAYCSGRNQVMMYKEDLEANFRTPYIYGYELLDLRDYLGQGTALVGVLDAFWDNKGYVEPEEWRTFCDELVLLARFPSYVFTDRMQVEIPVEICYFGREVLRDTKLSWTLKSDDAVLASGSLPLPAEIGPGKNIQAGTVYLDFEKTAVSGKAVFELQMAGSHNFWNLHIYSQKQDIYSRKSEMTGTDERSGQAQVVYTKSWKEAEAALREGRKVVYTPYLSQLNYNCPPLSMRPVFWNAQMGPNWIRSLGLSVDTGHPLFRQFETEAYGGWQWEDILSAARGFYIEDMPDTLRPAVRAIDDWNRNLPLALIFEAQVENGRLLLISADLEGSFEGRPAAYTLKTAALNYAASDDFKPKAVLQAGDIRRCLFSNHAMARLGAQYHAAEATEAVELQRLTDGNPNTSAVLRREQYPLSLEISFPQEINADGLVYMADQKDRMHRGDIREYEVEVCSDGEWMTAVQGAFVSTSRQQEIRFPRSYRTKQIRFRALSGFLEEWSDIWEGDREGWHKRRQRNNPLAEIAVLSVMTDEDVAEDDDTYWRSNTKSRTKEIDD